MEDYEEGEVADDDPESKDSLPQQSTSQASEDSSKPNGSLNEPAAKISTKREQSEDEFREIIEQKKRELAVLALASILPKESDEEEYRDRSKNSPEPKNGSLKEPSHEEPKAPKPPSLMDLPRKASAREQRRYDDLDKHEDPEEAMITNWARGSKSSKPKPKQSKPPPAESPEPVELRTLRDAGKPYSSTDYPDDVIDPYDDYYGHTSEDMQLNPIPSSGQADQDYRPKDQDYRRPDVDYRSLKPRQEKWSSSPSEEAEAEAKESEHGDVDMRPSSRGSPEGERRAKRARRVARSEREKRRRRHSSGSPQGSPRRGRFRASPPPGKRFRAEPGPPPGAPGAFPPRERDRNGLPICRFFKEGFCREGNSCSYSHDIDPAVLFLNKNPEVCRYYLGDVCRNGPKCNFLHGEFPCKFFHRGGCQKGRECRFSHLPLNDYTKPLLDKAMMEDERQQFFQQQCGPPGPMPMMGPGPPGPMPMMGPPGPGGPMPMMGPPGPGPMMMGPGPGDLYPGGGPPFAPGEPPNRRKVLLGAPPPFAPEDGPPREQMDMDQRMMGPPGGFPPPNMPYYNGPPGPGPGPPGPPQQGPMMQQGFGPPPQGMMYPQQMPMYQQPFPPQQYGGQQMPPQFGDQPPPQQQQEFSRQQREEDEKKEDGISSNFLLSVVNGIRQNVGGPEDSSNAPSSKRKKAPKPFEYRLVLVSDTPSSSGRSIYENIPDSLMHLSLSDTKLHNDPRLKRRADSAFDAVSRLITSGQKPLVRKFESPESPPPDSGQKDPRGRDPRADPRIKSSGPPEQPSSAQQTGSFPPPMMPPLLAMQPHVLPPMMPPQQTMPPSGGWMPTMPSGQSNGYAPPRAPFQYRKSPSGKDDEPPKLPYQSVGLNA